MKESNTSLSVNGQRLYHSLMELAKIGATEKGGNCRLALTKLDGDGRDLVVGWMKEAGLSVKIDQIGNIFGRREGRNPSLPPVMTGSHIDTQPTGGKFDGCFGVLAGLEVMRTLKERNIQTEYPVELAIWTNEEGTRFVPVLMGSGVFSGKFSLETALGAKDNQGKMVADELKAIGYAGTASAQGRELKAYFEAHIEQGPILEHEKKTIGVVTGGLGLRWYDVTVQGMEMHAGPTPMQVRQDALYAATYLMQAVIDIARENQPHGRGTVGVVQAHPGSRNVIPGKVTFTADLRHENVEVLAAMDAQFRQVCRDCESTHSVKVSVEDVQYWPPTPFTPNLVDTIRDSAQSCGYSHMDIVTGAGHDAVYISSVAPTAMIFIPCKDGISHNEIEDASPEDIEAGAQVLLHAMLQTAGY